MCSPGLRAPLWGPQSPHKASFSHTGNQGRGCFPLGAFSSFSFPRRQQLSCVTVEQQNWTPTLVTWGGVAGTGVIWITDWKLVLQYVPYIGGKFKTED
ncbi:cytochrome b-c1 complex subunit 10 [Athene cunicularia]|uniref:cytochrome b-c1 complex subunit 10 n=1 Tax=Athene cunicularia TaxID=194338 RepID=UPI000EF74FB2|nr:cytochrome b-c1 complex subunit 10 [Athene cunicularia]